ncbi:hypothetical protein Tco_1208582 [Tanacetum coccineum]
MNSSTCLNVLSYEKLPDPLQQSCSRVFTWDIYGDHAVSCAGIIGIKYRHNVVRDTLVDICYRPGISVGKKVDTRLDGRELEEDVVTLLKRIRKFSMIQDIGARATIHIFNMTSFAIAKRRVAKTIGLMDAIAKINDPQCELLLLRSCTGISRLYFTMRTCLPRVFEPAQRSFDVALRSSLERIVTASGSGFGD